MGTDFLRIVLYRFALPLTLLAACIVRYNGLSVIWLIFLLIVPLFPTPSRRSLKGKRLQQVILGTSVLIILSQATFQIALLAQPPYGHIIEPCSLKGILARQFGYMRLDGCNFVDILRLVAPDIIVFVVSLVCVLACRKIRISRPSNQQEQRIVVAAEASPMEDVIPVLVALMLLIGGITQPNVLSAVYLITFLILGSCWAFHKSVKLQKSITMVVVKSVLTCYCGLHLILLYLYQMEFFQELVDAQSFYARLLGLPSIILTSCRQGCQLDINRKLSWPFYAYPVVIFFLYQVLATEMRYKISKRLISADRSSYQTFGNGRAANVLPEEPAIRHDEQEEPANVQGTFSSIMMFLMRQSYIASLIIMMTWSITYHSWMTFVLLLWACLTWITPFARWFCMVSSPYLVIYSEILLLAQYVYGTNLDKELPTEQGDLDFSELGLKKWPYPCLHLGAQTLFVWVFWLTLRQHIREKKMKRRQVTAAGELVLSSLARPIVQAFKKRGISTERKTRVDSDLEEVDAGPPSDDAKEFMHWIKSTLGKYWIVVCCAAFLLVALQNNVSLYQILYMVIFLFGFIIYQFSVRVWKTVLRPLWWFMVIYSILILLTVYTYQFQNMHTYWSNGTHLTDEWLHDLGLRQHTKATLLVELLIPTIFSIVLVIQLHFFHKPLMMKVNRLTIQRRHRNKKDSIIRDVGKGSDRGILDKQTVEGLKFLEHAGGENNEHRTSDVDSTGEDHGREHSWVTNLAKLYSKVTFTLWRLGEIHALKIVSFIAFLVAVQQVSAINALFVILLAIAMPSIRMQKLMNYLMIVWASIVILVLMFYQLKFVKEDILKSNCTTVDNKTIFFGKNHFSSNAWWIGFRKSETVSVEVRGYIFIVLTIVAAKVIKHHQELHYFFKKSGDAEPGILFRNISRPMADENISSTLKYLCNNFFDSFGFEINLIVMVVCMGIRCDAYAVLHSLWVAVFLFVRRKVSERVWPFYVGFLSIMLPVQYILILGWPPGLCFDYPWNGTIKPSLVHWLYLTDVLHPQNQKLLIADYIQLMVACCQEKVFVRHRQSKKSSNQAKSDSIVVVKDGDGYSPPDFMVNKTWLDFLKIITFEQLYWLTLSIVYITAQNTTSLFNFGFIVSCFFFLWHGQSLYLRPRQTMRRWWKIFIGYNFFVIVAKVWLQLVSCVWINKIPMDISCVVIQLLNLYCLHHYNYKSTAVTLARAHCKVESDTGLTMDSVCFIFALIQYRIFKSTYFKYVIREHRRQADMASRGAQLVEERLQIRLADSIEKDKSKMEEIRSKVSRLKAKRSRLKEGYSEPISHYEAIYSGDSYFLDSDGSDEEGEHMHLRPTEDEGGHPENREHEREKSSAQEEGGDEDIAQGSGGSQDADSDASRGTTPSHSRKKGTELRRRKGHRDDDIQPLPGPSHEESEDPQEAKGCTKEVKEFVGKTVRFFGEVADRMISLCNDISEDYRSITVQLERERKEKCKEFSTHVTQEPHTSAESNILNKTGPSNTSSTRDEESDTWSLITTEEDGTDGWQKQDSRGVRLAVAFYYALLANTDLLCYAFLIINHMYYACILSLPLPFFVFLWGMLSIPRPTKRFWIAVITYVELAIVLKYVFQFQFFTFNDCSQYPPEERNTPLCPPRIIGIERNAYSSVCDLLLLLALFFHRFALKAHGLWRERSWNEEEDTILAKTPDEGAMTLEPATVEEQPAEIQYQNKDEATQRPVSSSTSSTPSHVTAEHKKKGVFHNIRRFVERMLDPGVGTGAVDVYAWMFGCQFAVFLIIAFSWSAFSSPETSEKNFAKIIEENVVPKTFLYMLLTQFLLIVIDRFLYLRKFVFAKLLYLALLMFLFHVFMFLIVPELTNNRFTENIPAIFMYIFQCIYFGLSAYQVRCGYPTRILGNFLTKTYTLTSGILFQGIQAIPFLLELRSVLDWMCTDTTLSLTHWLKIEDIYANIYVLKCWRDSEKTWPHPRGMKYWLSSKWLLGGLLVFLLIVVIWFPLLFMSFINSAYISNTPVDATFTLTVGGYQPLFRVSAQKQFLRELSREEIKEIIFSDHNVKEKWNKMKVDSFLESYPKSGNIVKVRVLGNSNAVWAISPPSRQFLIQDLMSNATISMRFKFEFNREPKTAQAALVQETVSGFNVKVLPPKDPTRVQLAELLKSTKDGAQITIKDLFPSFIQVPASGPAKPVAELGGGSMVTCHVRLRKGGIPQMNDSMVEWWEIVQVSPKPIFDAKSDNNSMEIITFNDFVPPLHLSFFASKGIIGLYVGFVWLIGKFVRLFFTSISYRIMFDEMPNVDKVLKLCLEIYMVRESKELELEEDLFAKLMFLYRSPETLIKWTKYKRH